MTIIIRAARLSSLLLGLGVLVGASWSIVEDAKRLTGFAAFTALGFVGLALIVTAFLPRRRFTRMFVPLITLLLPLYAFEALSSANAFGGAFQPQDGRNKAQVVADLRRNGENAFPAASPTHFLYDPLTLEGRKILPLSGLPNVRTVLCQEADGWVTYESDHYGFNNPDAVWVQPEHIVVFGDSFVHGACLSSGLIFPDLLRSAFSGTVNLGMTGSGPLTMLATLKEYLPALRPRVVVWSYYDGNDLYRRDGASSWRGDLEEEWGSRILRAYLEENRLQGLIASATRISPLIRERLDLRFQAQPLSSFPSGNLLPALAGLRRTLSLQTCLGLIRSLLSPTSGDKASQREAERLRRDQAGIEADLKLFGRILAEARRHIENRGAKALFLYLPSIEEFTRSSGPHPLRSQVLETARKAGFEIVDMEEYFRHSGEPEKNYAFGKRGGHFSVLGHQHVADALLAQLAAFPAPTPRYEKNP